MYFTLLSVCERTVRDKLKVVGNFSSGFKLVNSFNSVSRLEKYEYIGYTDGERLPSLNHRHLNNFTFPHITYE